MSDIITTLHKKGDNTINVYPNIKNENIPSASITGDKLANGSVGTNQLVANAVASAKISSSAVTASKIATGAVTNTKIEDGAVTTDKLANGAVDNSKLASNAVSTSNIVDGAVTDNKLSNDIKALFDNINRTYGLFVGEVVSDILVATMYFGNTTLPSAWNNYSSAQINSALNFNKAQSDYSNTDLDIIALIIDGIYNTDVINGNYTNVEYGDIQIIIRKDALTSTYSIYYLENDVVQFQLSFVLDTHTISDYVNTKTIHFTLKKTITV